MTTFAKVIARTRSRLMTTQREPVNVLATGIDADDTTLSFVNAVTFHNGGRLSVGLEDMHVVTAATSGSSGEVIRAMNGSAAAAHAAGDLVHIHPTWSNWDIAQAVNDELHALSAPTNGLFRIQSVDFDFQPAVQGYDLAGLTDYLDIWRVRYRTSGPANDWPILSRSVWHVDRDADTADFASGTGLVLHAGGEAGQKVRVSYKATFDELTDVDDDVEAVAGLHAQAHDILSLGAAIRLLSGLEAQRAYSTTQADTRYAAEIPPRTAVSALVPLVEQREERIREEQSRLARSYPESL